MKLETAIKLTNHKSMAVWRETTRKALQEIAQEVQRADILAFMIAELRALQKSPEPKPKTE